jgi:hypothetical protein
MIAPVIELTVGLICIAAAGAILIGVWDNRRELSNRDR